MAPLLFFFNDTATTEIYTLSLHDALPICEPPAEGGSNPTVDFHGEKRSNETHQSVKVHRRIAARSEEHTSELQSPDHLVCRLLLEKKKQSIPEAGSPTTDTPLTVDAHTDP